MRQVLRQEKKFLVDPVASMRLRRRLRAVMMEDAHNGPTGYIVRSLYFDTVNDRDFIEKFDGTDPRRKVRLRTYDPASDMALLEIKQKQGEVQLKRSLVLSRAEASRLIEGDLTWMLARSEPFAAEVYAFMRIHAYRPRAIIEYRRQAFIAPVNEIRVTFDSDIRATEANVDLFDATAPLHPVLDPFDTILEVKYNGFLLSYIKDALNAVEKRPVSVSKYSLGRDTTYWSGF